MTGKLEVSGWHTFPNARRIKEEKKRKSEPSRLMFLVLPGKQKPVTMYVVAVKQRLSVTVEQLTCWRCLGVTTKGLFQMRFLRVRTAIHSILY